MGIATFADNNPSLAIHANTTRGRELPSSNRHDVIAILVEHVDATVATISHQDVVIRINKEMKGILDLPSTHNANKIALRIEDLQPIATLFSHHNIPIRQKTNTNRTLHLTISLSKRPKLSDKLTFGVENLNAMVVVISDNNSPLELHATE